MAGAGAAPIDARADLDHRGAMRSAAIIVSLGGALVAGPVAAAAGPFEPSPPGPRLGLGAGVEVAPGDDDVTPTVLARMAWGRIALEPAVTFALAGATTEETASGYDAEGDGSSRAALVTVGVRVELARRGDVGFGLLGRVGGGYAWEEARGPGPSDDVAVRSTTAAIGGGFRLEWAAVGPLVLLVDATTDLAAWSHAEREGGGLLTTTGGWRVGVEWPGTLRAVALITF